MRKGDTLYLIAQRYKSSPEAILRANRLFEPVTDRGTIYIGNVLVVPSLLETGKVSYIVKPGDTLNQIASKFSTSIDLISGINRIENPNTIFPDQQLIAPLFIYQIQPNDTLSSISRKFGISLLSITKANRGRPGFQEDVIWPEFHLILPLPTSRNSVLWNPLPGSRVFTRQRLEGQARAFEANVLHQLRDANGVIVSNKRFTTADEGAPAYGNFNSSLPFDRSPTSNTGEIWVYTRSAKDGSIQDLVRTKVYFS
ncbi:MAG TPA: LysM peptidoglycan-binding domain-containing protein [Bacillus sp. (in: firmicutes)]